MYFQIKLIKLFFSSGKSVSIISLGEWKEKVAGACKPIYKLSNYGKRGVSGVNGNYHLDHKYSILEGYKNKISPEIIGNIKNLEFIPWEENIKKRTKNSITINELIK